MGNGECLDGEELVEWRFAEDMEVERLFPTKAPIL